MTAPAGPKVAERQGALVDTWLEDWHRVPGGWAATICCEPGVYDSAKYLNARTAIASAYKMRASMITLIPDVDDETRCLVLAQRTSPITGEVRWVGPEGIDSENGLAQFARYADGGTAWYEMWRNGWGCPHDAFFGTTGSGKSEAVCMALILDRWFNWQGRGMVASFLIDPQQGQSYAPFLDDLAAPVASTLAEATLMVESLHIEAIRRNRYLAREATWWDPKRKKMRTGRKWWDPRIDGPLLTCTIDEAHAFLADQKFAALVAAASRMWRKCGLKLRIATHTPLLSDLGNSMALRDMLTGGFVWIGRVANGLTGQLAFNGRLPVDPRLIEQVPGTAYILTGLEPKPMKSRTMWEPDWYDWIRDESDEPIGHQTELPMETWAGLGAEFRNWCEWARLDTGEVWTPPQQAAPVEKPVDQTCARAIVTALTSAAEPVDADILASLLATAGHTYTTSTVRHARAELKTAGTVEEIQGPDGVKRWRLSDRAREDRGARVLEGAAA